MILYDNEYFRNFFSSSEYLEAGFWWAAERHANTASFPWLRRQHQLGMLGLHPLRRRVAVQRINSMMEGQTRMTPQNRSLSDGFMQHGHLPFVRRSQQKVRIQAGLQRLPRLSQRRVVSQERRGAHDRDPFRMDQALYGLKYVLQ